MGKENLEKISSERLLTAPEVIYKLLQKHPEVIQISVATYLNRSHGEESIESYRGYIPVDYENSSLADGKWRRANFKFGEVEAIGSMVDICSREGCDHSPKSHFEDQLYLWQLWHDGVEAPHGFQESFIFLDIEMKEPEIMERVTEVLQNVPEDWYILHSGDGFHVILDRLIKIEKLPREYGKLIAFFGEKLGNNRLRRWGEDLKRVANDSERVLSWGELVREKIGHINEPIYQEGKEVYIIDLRHVAVSLKKVKIYHDWLIENKNRPFIIKYDPVSHIGCSRAPDKIGGFYLRISPKRKDSSPPVLVAQKEVGKIQFFRTVDDLLKSQKQQRLF